MIPVLSIAAWSAWDSDQGTPELPWIPSLQRRRLSPLDRVACQLARECFERAAMPSDASAMVLASRLGELCVLARILESIRLREPVSPANFGGSVHHAALGHLSILNKNRMPARAVSAGPSTFAAGFWETFCMAEAHPGAPVLLLAVEDTFPTPFLGDACNFSGGASGLGILLAPEALPGLPALTISVEGDGAPASPEALLAWLRAPDNNLTLALPSGVLRCLATRP